MISFKRCIRCLEGSGSGRSGNDGAGWLTADGYAFYGRRCMSNLFV